jgi:hypothetical protein
MLQVRGGGAERGTAGLLAAGRLLLVAAPHDKARGLAPEGEPSCAAWAGWCASGCPGCWKSPAAAGACSAQPARLSLTFFLAEQPERKYFFPVKINPV